MLPQNVLFIHEKFLFSWCLFTPNGLETGLNPFSVWKTEYPFPKHVAKQAELLFSVEKMDHR
jgi:hypothetical protein